MADSTTPQDSGAMPPASHGSVARRELRAPDWRGVPVDLWIDSDGDLGLMGAEQKESVVIHRNAIPAIAAWLGRPTLTDAERELISRLAEEREDGHPRAWTNRALTADDRATLRGLLERLG